MPQNNGDLAVIQARVQAKTNRVENEGSGVPSHVQTTGHPRGKLDFFVIFQYLLRSFITLFSTLKSDKIYCIERSSSVIFCSLFKSQSEISQFSSFQTKMSLRNVFIEVNQALHTRTQGLQMIVMFISMLQSSEFEISRQDTTHTLQYLSSTNSRLYILHPRRDVIGITQLN